MKFGVMLPCVALLALASASSINGLTFQQQHQMQQQRETQRQALLAKYRAQRFPFEPKVPVYGRGKAQSHLDVGLPDSLINSDGSLLIHLKDQGLWDKENSVSSRKNSKAVMLPSYLKSLFMDHLSGVEDAPDDTNIENIVRSKEDFNIPQTMMMNLDTNGLDSIPDFDDLEGLIYDEGLAKTLMEVENPDDKHGFYFDLKDAFKKAYETRFKAQENVNESPRLRSMSNPGVFFDLKELETQLKEKMSGISKSDDADSSSGSATSDDTRDRASFSIAETLEEYVKDKVAADRAATDEQQVHAEKIEDTAENKNALMLAELVKSNVTIQAVDEDGGIHFNLGQENPVDDPSDVQ